MVKDPLENYESAPIIGKRNQDIPVGDIVVAESDSYLTGRPAYSKVNYKQKTIWVFDVLTKTSVLSKKKAKPIYDKKKAQNVIYK